MTPNSRKRATRAQYIRMHDLLKTVLIVEAPADPTKPKSRAMVKYKDGWNDEIVARTIDPTLSPFAAIGVREELHGILRLPRVASKDEQTEARDELLREMEGKLHHLQVMHNKAMTLLHLKKADSNFAELTIVNRDGTII